MKKYKVQTVNGNPEVILVINGIAREIVDIPCLTVMGATVIANRLNKAL